MNQVIPHSTVLLENWHSLYRSRNSLPFMESEGLLSFLSLEPIPSQMNPIRAIISYICKIPVDIILHDKSMSLKWFFFLSGFSTKISNAFIISPICPTCLVCLIHLDFIALTKWKLDNNLHSWSLYREFCFIWRWKWKEVGVLRFKSLFTHLHRGTKKIHENISYSRQCSGCYRNAEFYWLLYDVRQTS
jgi:hypothetical protein